MKMDTSEVRPLRMMIVYAGSESGFYVAMVPAAVTEERLEAALRELGVDAQATFELGGWRTTSDDVTVARVPALEGE
jgi:hypothetical protein